MSFTKREIALIDRVAELEAALRKHGEHMSGCATWHEDGRGCTCGLHAVLSVGESPDEETTA